MRRLTAEQRDERIAARARVLAERRREREARRTENKNGWPRNVHNANYRHEQEREALIIEADEPAPGNSLDHLRQLMECSETPVGQRISCAEGLLAYETAPGSMALAPASAEAIAAGSAYTFLKRIAATPGLAQPLLVKVLRLLASVEAIRASRIDPDQLGEKRELLRCLVNAERRRWLREAGRLPAGRLPHEPGRIPPPDGYALTASDQFGWPPGWPGSWSWPPDNFGDLLDAARAKPAAQLDADLEACRERLRAIRAVNRPDCWQEWRAPEPIERDPAA